MVSQPDHSSLSGGSGVSSASTTLLTLRGAAKSVIGTASTSGHRHRSGRHRDRENHRHYNRSYAGGASAYVPQNEFPWFSHSGDVEIVVKVPSGHANCYLLHRHTLTRCSGFFEASTSDPWSKAVDVVVPNALPAGNELAKIGEDNDGVPTGASRRVGTPRKRWRYELDCGARGDDIPMLVQKEDSTPGHTATQSAAMASLASPTSIFGGSATSSTVSASGRKHAHSQSHPRDFSRSVAALPLASSSTAYAPPPPLLPPPPPPPTSDNANLPAPTLDEQDVLRDYDNLFRVMYNFPPVLDGINIADAYVQCKSLLTLADQYDALAVVGPRVDHHLLQFQSRLWKQIAKYPISYLRLGYLARSRVIFQEALIHVVGQWPAGERSLRASLPGSVLDIIEDKVDEMEENVARVEGRLFRLNLTTRNGERVTPATGYLDWLAVSLFRQWLADNTTPPPVVVPVVPPRTSGRHRAGSDALVPAEGGARAAAAAAAAAVSSNLPSIPPLSSLGRTYRTLGNPTGQGFLGHDECKRFLKLTPEMYSRDNLRRFEKRIDELKALAREVVRPIMGSSLELDLLGARGPVGGIGYLTCTRVAERDLPW